MTSVRKDTADQSGIDTPIRLHNLGIIYAEESEKGITHPFFQLILNAFKQEAESHGYDITFLNENARSKEKSYLERCHESRLDGICMVCGNFDDPQIKDLVAGDLPFVVVDHLYKKVPAVLSDNETGIQKLVEYAISRGHTRIAFVHGQNNSIVTQTRIKQFYNVMQYHDLPVPEGYVRESLYNNIELTRKVVKEVLRMPERPTCILLADDISYLGAQDAARELGLSIPADISFTGYDGIPLTQALTPKLTTIRQGSDQMGKMAAKKLIDLIEKPETTKRVPVIFPVELLEGGTVAKI